MKFFDSDAEFARFRPISPEARAFFRGVVIDGWFFKNRREGEDYLVINEGPEIPLKSLTDIFTDL